MPSHKKPDEGRRQGFLDFDRMERSPIRKVEVQATSSGSDASGTSEPRVFSVSEVVRAAARMLEARFPSVWVEGEISNLSQPRSGHVYFTLKDDSAQLPAVMFRAQAQRLRFRLEDGQKLRARGRLSIYDGQGKFQLYADDLEPVGLGALQLAFEQLKERLGAEGLFDTGRKRPLPRWPRRIGVVTSPTGAAIRDILRIAERRGRTRFLLAPCQVQGVTAPMEIVAALRLLQKQPDIDVIIVGRGGGSAEDLAAFNDERLARAIAACPVPVVSAVGHEVDFTIADFVADLRAPTPSAAAELVVPLFSQLVEQIDQARERLLRAGRRQIDDARLELDGELGRASSALGQKLTRARRQVEQESRRLAALHPTTRLHRDRADLQLLATRLRRRMEQQLLAERRTLGVATGKLDALSPLRVLERGYSLVRTSEGHVVTDADQVSPGEKVEVRLARGTLGCAVESTPKRS
jgi:exodeoxyribonuclease VII large subunit